MDLVWLSEADLAAMKARCDAATPGPWHSPGGATVALGSGYPHPSFSATSTMGAYDEDKRAVRKRKSVYPTQDDAEFIAHSREDVPRLIAALEAVTRERDEVQSERDGYDAALTLAVKGNTNSIREIHRLGAALATAEAKLAAVAALDTTWLNRFSDNKMADPTAEFEQYIEWFEEEPNDRKYVEAFAVNVYAMREIIAQALRIARVVTQPSDDEAETIENAYDSVSTRGFSRPLRAEAACHAILAFAEKGI